MSFEKLRKSLPKCVPLSHFQIHLREGRTQRLSCVVHLGLVCARRRAELAHRLHEGLLLAAGGVEL